MNQRKIIFSSVLSGIAVLIVILVIVFYFFPAGRDSGNPPDIPIIFIMIATLAAVVFIVIIKFRRQSVLQNEFEEQLYPEGQPDSFFSVRIGTFDEKLGPICLNAQRNVWCDFASEKCNGVTSRNIMEALSIDKENVFFEENGTIFQGINFNFTDPGVRGHVRKYSILIKYDKKRGRIKDEIISQIREEFTQSLGFKYPISREQAVAFTERWEGILQEKKNVTDVEELKQKIKEEKIISQRSQIWGSYGLRGLSQNRRTSVIITMIITILLVVGMVFFIAFQSSSDTSSSASSSSSGDIWVILSGVTIAVLAGVFVVFSRRRQSNQMNTNNNSTF